MSKSTALVLVARHGTDIIDADFHEVIPRPSAHRRRAFDLDALLRHLTKAELMIVVKGYGCSASTVAHCLLMDAYTRSSQAHDVSMAALKRVQLATTDEARRRARLAEIGAEKASLDIDAEIERWKALCNRINAEAGGND